jgi:hypothetical protein
MTHRTRTMVVLHYAPYDRFVGIFIPFELDATEAVRFGRLNTVANKTNNQ